jgi:DNA repair ATPase RecN
MQDRIHLIKNLRDHQKMHQLIDHIGLQVEQSRKLLEEYHSAVKLNPNRFETVYMGLSVLSKNTDIFNNKIEVLEKFMQEIDKRLELLTGLFEETYQSQKGAQ